MTTSATPNGPTEAERESRKRLIYLQIRIPELAHELSELKAERDKIKAAESAKA